jgi:hypothetical protein
LKRKHASLIYAACVAGAIAWCWLLASAQAQARSLQVELDAFSGRPNPSWELTGAQAADFVARLRALQPVPEARPSGDGLGYRGFIVRATSEPIDGYDEVTLYRGTVLARQGSRTTAFIDRDRTLERQLLDSARGHVPEPVLQYVASEIGG